MNRFNSWKSRFRARFGRSLALGFLFVAASSWLLAEDTKPTDSGSSDAKAAGKSPASAPAQAPAGQAKKEAAPASTPKKHKLTGSELYAINCNRCHPERYPTEFDSAQWKTIMLHMRVRANLPAAQAKEILKYLQEESGN